MAAHIRKRPQLAGLIARHHHGFAAHFRGQKTPRLRDGAGVSDALPGPPENGALLALKNGRIDVPACRYGGRPREIRRELVIVWIHPGPSVVQPPEPPSRRREPAARPNLRRRRRASPRSRAIPAEPQRPRDSAA